MASMVLRRSRINREKEGSFPCLGRRGEMEAQEHLQACLPGKFLPLLPALSIRPEVDLQSDKERPGRIHRQSTEQGSRRVRV